MPEPTPAPEGVAFTLNGREAHAAAGTILVDAAAQNGIEIPIFCYEPRIGPPIGACRMCLVEVEGMRGLQTACSTPVTADMVVRSDTDAVRDAHDGVLELLLVNHPLDCPVCDKGGECPLQDRTFKFGPGRSRTVEPKRHFPKPLDLSPLVAIDRERCITCFRCVRFSQDVAQDAQLTFQERGNGTEVATYSGEAYLGRFTGNIIDLCPVGALTSIPYRFVSRPWDLTQAPTVCAQCPVGCNSDLTVREGEIKRVTGREVPNMQVEEGWLCDKGRWAYPESRSPDRLLDAVLVDRPGRRRVPLQRAVDTAGLILRSATAPAILLGSAATVEEGFLARELARDALGDAPVARLGRPGHGLEPLRALPGAQLGDLDRADLLVVVGGDPANQQPVIELRVRKALRVGARLVSAGPRPHALESLGTSHRTAPGRLAEAIPAVAEAVAGAESPIVLWDEADLAAEPDAAAALAGAIAEAGARQVELGHEVGGPGLRALGIPTAEGLLEEVLAGRVTELILVHADLELAAGAARWAEALERVRRLIVIATHDSPAASKAEVLLPALTSYEQEGVLVSMNGRAQRLRPGDSGPEGAAPAWEYLIALSHRLSRPMPYRAPAHAFAAAAAAHAALAGMSYESLGLLGQVLPPAPAPAAGAAPAARTPEGEGLPLVTTTRIYGDRPSHRSDALAEVRTGAEAALAPAQAEALGLADGDRAELTSPHGSCTLPVRVDAALAEGAAFVTTGVPGAGVEALLPPDAGPVRVALARVAQDEEIAA